MIQTHPRPLQYEGITQKPPTGFNVKKNYTVLWLGAAVIIIFFITSKTAEPLVPHAPQYSSSPYTTQPYP